MFPAHQIKYSEYPPFLILGNGLGPGQKTKRTEKINRGKNKQRKNEEKTTKKRRKTMKNEEILGKTKKKQRKTRNNDQQT